MSQRLNSEIVVNLSGNLAQKAKRYSGAMQSFAQSNSKMARSIRGSMTLVNRSLDSVENRYVGLVAAVAGGAVGNRIMTLDRQLSRLAVAAGITRENVKTLYDDIEGASREFHIDPAQALSAVNVIMEKIGDLDYAMSNKRNISMVIQATGADGASVGSVFTNLKEKMGLESEDEILQAIDILNLQGKQGAFTLQHMAQYGNAIFSAYAATGRTGMEGVQELGAIMQVVNASAGTEAQAVTAVEAFLRDTVLSAPKRKKLNQVGIDIFDPEKLKEGIEIMRPMNEIASDVLTKGDRAAKNAGKTLSDFLAWVGFESESIKVINAIRSDFIKDGEVKSFDQFMEISGDGTATLKDAQTVASDSAAAFQSLVTALDSLARNELSGPIGELADAINSLDQQAVDNWLKTGKYIAYTVGSLIVARKAIGIAKDLKSVFGKKGAKSQGGADMGFGLGVMPVFVTNMPGSLGGSLTSGGKTPSTRKPTKTNKMLNGAKNAGRLFLPALLAYEGSDMAMGMMPDWVHEADKKFTTQVKAAFGSKEAQAQMVKYFGADPKRYHPKTFAPSSYLTGDYQQPQSGSNYSPLNGRIDVSVKTFHDGREPNVSIDLSGLPGAAMED
ncbi:hypothetical protein [Vibrio sp. LaRot3]|uniref:hypothetical protein n=1 Tax=Vibrio sp. LaRot3 TaxID=2998829 RepID=UPI0022CDFA61|nr:hypothetical protein [Vibrio sp. LaRot3]MDA0148858.1 hypothetical protein [Vibrio sp. LaRot3]